MPNKEQTVITDKVESGEFHIPSGVDTDVQVRDMATEEIDRMIQQKNSHESNNK